VNRVIKSEVFLFLMVLVATACTKIETTTLGADIIPDVDNINTFDTILEVNAYNEIPTDSTRIFGNDPHVLGAIDNDPYFGTSKSAMFFEMRPTEYPFLMSVDSIVKFDSAVLILAYGGYYGDSTSPVNVRLYEVDNQMFRDTTALPFYTFQPDLSANTSKFWGQKTMQARQFKDTIAIKRGDSVYSKVNNQLRIPLDKTLAEAMFRQDTATGAFKSDSAFRAYFKGFALQAEGPANAMFYLGLNNANSRIEFYYQAKILSTGKLDTASKSFGFSNRCGHAMKFDRNRSGSEVMSFLNPDPTKGSTQLYVQAAPGTVVKLKIPGIKTLTNRIIHRAELRVTEMTPNANSAQPQLIAPQLLFLDVADSNNTYRGIPYDMSPLSNYFCYPLSGVEYSYFGGPSKIETVNSERLNVYRFNLSRYIQGVITRKETTYDFRISAPYYVDYKNCFNTTVSLPSNFYLIKNANGNVANYPGDGRIRLAGSNHPDPNKKMQLRIIYSKL
jgi:Domain of unknown function (DUF4270)